LISTYRNVRKPARGGIKSEPNRVESVLKREPLLERVVEAIRLAPSPHNIQPWSLALRGPREITVGWARERAVPAVDPLGHAIAIGLGCGIEAAATVADIDIEPGTLEDVNAPGYHAAVLRVRALRGDDYAGHVALLRKRCTNRHAFLRDPLASSLPSRCSDVASALGVHAVFACPDRAEVKRLAMHGALRLLEQQDYQEELLAHMRLDRTEEERLPTGFSRDALAMSWPVARTLAVLRDSAALRALANGAGLARIMAEQATQTVDQCAGYVLIATPNWTNRGRVDAGRAMMRVWLELTRDDVACQPVDFPISYDEGRVRITQLFGLPDTVRPIALLRVGRALRRPQRAAPRLPVRELCTLAAGAERQMETQANRPVGVGS
jgi:nitroreductase